MNRFTTVIHLTVGPAWLAPSWQLRDEFATPVNSEHAQRRKSVYISLRSDAQATRSTEVSGRHGAQGFNTKEQGACPQEAVRHMYPGGEDMGKATQIAAICAFGVVATIATIAVQAAEEAAASTFVTLKLEGSCDAQNTRLWLVNSHTFKTIATTVRWKAAGGKDLREQFFRDRTRCARSAAPPKRRSWTRSSPTSNSQSPASSRTPRAPRAGCAAN